MEYTKLEKKIIKKGKSEFYKELQEASKPMLVVLKKFGVTHSHELLAKITLNYPYSNETYYQYAVRIPDNEGLKSIEDKILENFMAEIKELAERVDDLGL